MLQVEALSTVALSQNVGLDGDVLAFAPRDDEQAFIPRVVPVHRLGRLDRVPSELEVRGQVTRVPTQHLLLYLVARDTRQQRGRC